LNVDVPNLLAALGITDWKERNGEIWAPCPYPGHPEKEPSWSIRWDGPQGQRNGRNHCFGCHAEGGAIHLVKEVIGFDLYPVAAEWITDKGLDIDDVAPMAARLVVRGERGVGMLPPRGTETGPLSGWVTPPRRYAERRGITPDQVERWALGYGVAGRMTARLYLPTYDVKGRLLNWTARSINGREPRYRNPDEGEGANLASVFGERYWPEHPGRSTLVLCEGELNALAVERAGAEFVGALGGSKVDARQLLRVSRFAKVILATDVDRAGSAAAATLKASLVRWRNVARVEFPPGLDPCDIEAREGIEALGDLLCRADG